MVLVSTGIMMYGIGREGDQSLIYLRCFLFSPLTLESLPLFENIIKGLNRGDSFLLPNHSMRFPQTFHSFGLVRGKRLALKEKR